jgi:flagellar FliL protein
MAQAKNEPPPTGAQEEAPKPKKKSKLPIIIAALVLLGGGGGGAAWYFMGGHKAGGHGAEAKKEEPEKPPVFTRLEQFTVNLQKSDGEDHYLQVEVDLQIAEDKVNEHIKLRMPQIRNAMLLTLSSKTADELSSVEGKQKLAADIAGQINKIIGAKEPKEGVVNVYFSSFVIQ